MDLAAKSTLSVRTFEIIFKAPNPAVLRAVRAAAGGAWRWPARALQGRADAAPGGAAAGLQTFMPVGRDSRFSWHRRAHTMARPGVWPGYDCSNKT